MGHQHPDLHYGSGYSLPFQLQCNTLCDGVSHDDRVLRVLMVRSQPEWRLTWGLQVSHADKGRALQTELEHLRTALETERGNAQAEQAAAADRLREAEQQLDNLGGKLLDAEAVAYERVQ